MGDKDTVKVFLRKSELGIGAQSIDLKSLREVIEKTRKKQREVAALSKLVLTPIHKRASTKLVEPKSGQVAPSSENKMEIDAQEGAQPNSDCKMGGSERDSLKHVSEDSSVIVKKRLSDSVFDDSSAIEEPQVIQAVDSEGQPKTEYSCCFCDYLTKSDDDYRKHISSHIKNKALRCNLCSFSADKITTYNDHVKEVHGKNSPLKTAYVCSVCSYKCLTVDRLLKHKSTAGHCDKGKSCQKCKICGLSDFNICKLLQHVVNHSRDVNECQLCNNPERNSLAHDEDCPETVSPVIHQYEELLEPLPKKMFTCTLCDFQCEELLFLLEHIKAHARHKLSETGSLDGIKEADYPFCCTMCDYRCVRPSKLASHMKTHALGAIFQCKDCPFESKDLAYFRAHRKIHVENQGFTCFVCLTKFNRHEALKAHMMSHWKTKPFSCDFCEYKCITKARLIMHLKSHQKKKTQVFFPCPLCANKYSTSTSLRNHLRTHNTDGKPYQCDFCDYTCFTSELLRVHVLKHSTGASKTRCGFCLRNFHNESALKAHMKEHRGVRNRERCELCNRCFPTKAQLASHITLHLGLKSVNCNICNMKFPDSESKQAHILSAHSNISGDKRSSCTESIGNAETDEGKGADMKIEDESKEKYGFVEEDVCDESGSEEEEEVHLGQHQLIGYPEMVTE